ncbi:unnamed protein product [Ectocarpus sp. 4 AP-2014]
MSEGYASGRSPNVQKTALLSCCRMFRECASGRSPNLLNVLNSYAVITCLRDAQVAASHMYRILHITLACCVARCSRDARVAAPHSSELCLSNTVTLSSLTVFHHV